jgi:hypothetical protein
VVNLKEFDAANEYADETMKALLVTELMNNPVLFEEMMADVERVFREFLQRKGKLP